MSASRYDPFAIRPDYEAIELPYVGRKLVMLIVMPDDPRAFDRSPDASTLSDVVDSLDPSDTAKEPRILPHPARSV